MKNYVAYKILCSAGEERDILIAQLAAIGFEGFEEDDTSVLASAKVGEVEESEVETWLDEQTLGYEKAITPDQNWNALWESNFSPVVVNDFACIRAHFHPKAEGVLYDIEITPKMSFGTGHHATTRQMVELMKDLPISGKRVFDFGTGTGVLAILAAKMGALEVEAIDHDEWSITNAAENIMVNSIGYKIKLRQADKVDAVKPSDIVLANINKHILLRFMPDLKEILKPDGYLVLSGLLVDDEQDIEQAARTTGLTKVKRSELNNWIALVFR
jgi:ribosomal protein L11 methyltransferase